MSPKQNRIRAAYYRGGTSRALFFKESDLPNDRNEWAPIFRGAMGSPDPHGRQLDGMGTGISSLSKIAVIGPSARKNVDIDYTFVQVGVKDGEVDYSSNCGNISSAVGPFAVDSGMLGHVKDGRTTVRIFNTNTNKLIESFFEVDHGEAAVSGDLSIAGVAGTGAKVELAFVNPEGSRTGKLLPTGNTVDHINGIRVSCIDVANPCIFVKAVDCGIDGTILPEAAEANPKMMGDLEKLRRKASVVMGLANDEASAPESVPKLVIVAAPFPYKTISGEQLDTSSIDLLVRSISGLGLHRAVQITASLATAAAANIKGSIVHELVSKEPVSRYGLILGHPSGTLMVSADGDDSRHINKATVFRTARRLMEGQIYWRG